MVVLAAAKTAAEASSKRPPKPPFEEPTITASFVEANEAEDASS